MSKIEPPRPEQCLTIPIGWDRAASVPFPMSEEDFTMLISTLELWRKRMVATVPTLETPERIETPGVEKPQ